MAKPAILVKNLVCDFETVHAIDDLSLEVPRGVNFGILGPGKAGKTTLVKLLLGLISPTGGEIEILGFDPIKQNKEIYRRVGILLNPPDLYESLSALDNMEFFAWSRGLRNNEKQERIHDLLNHFELWERRKEIIENWDRESRQKLGLAITFLHQPSLVFLDEPTAGMNPSAAAGLREKIASLISYKTTLFLTTENQSEAKRLCDEVAIIQDGKIVISGTPAELNLQGGRTRMEIKGQGFDEQILTMINSLSEVAAASNQDQKTIIDLESDADPNVVINQLSESGVTIEEIYWSEDISNIMTDADI
jgi:ABC-2 type transport system ATP-binding protein